MCIRTYAMLLALVGAGMANAPLRAADPPAISSYLTDDVVAVGRLNLERVDIAATVDELLRLTLITGDVAEEAKGIAAKLQQAYAELPKRGAKRLYLLLRPSDLAAEGMTWMIEADSPEAARAVAQWVQVQLEGMTPPSGLEQLLPKAIETEGAFVVGGPSGERIKQALQQSASTRKEAVAAIESLDDADAGLVVFGNHDSRRVVRDMFPQLPAPFNEIDGKLLADGIVSGSVTVKLPPEPVVTVAVEMSDEARADVVSQAFEKGRTLLNCFLSAQATMGPEAHRQRAAALLPMLPQLKLQREGTRLTVAFGDDESEIAFLRNLLPALAQQARDEAYRSARMYNFKQLALGLLNYESANKKFPAQALYSEDGRPLLSWRVMILPYLEEKALYDQFKLDEPWDSEHNRKLIEKMPAVFADPAPSVRTAAGAGKTTYLSTVGEGFFFEGQEPRTIRSITDGTSNTAWLFETAPERAVPWTKPEDLKDLAAVLERKDRDWFTAGFVDGHVRILSTKNEAPVLKALLTPAGKEVVEHAEIK